MEKPVFYLQYNIIKQHNKLSSRFILKKNKIIQKKFQIFDQNNGLTPLEKCKFFDHMLK